jgi:hypothetical protein
MVAAKKVAIVLHAAGRIQILNDRIGKIGAANSDRVGGSGEENIPTLINTVLVPTGDPEEAASIGQALATLESVGISGGERKGSRSAHPIP